MLRTIGRLYYSHDSAQNKVLVPYSRASEHVQGERFENLIYQIPKAMGRIEESLWLIKIVSIKDELRNRVAYS